MSLLSILRQHTTQASFPRTQNRSLFEEAQEFTALCSDCCLSGAATWDKKHGIKEASQTTDFHSNCTLYDRRRPSVLDTVLGTLHPVANAHSSVDHTNKRTRACVHIPSILFFLLRSHPSLVWKISILPLYPNSCSKPHVHSDTTPDRHKLPAYMTPTPKELPPLLAGRVRRRLKYRDGDTT